MSHTGFSAAQAGTPVVRRPCVHIAPRSHLPRRRGPRGSGPEDLPSHPPRRSAAGPSSTAPVHLRPPLYHRRIFHVEMYVSLRHRNGGSTNLHQVLCEKRIQGCRNILDVENSLRGCRHEPKTSFRVVQALQGGSGETADNERSGRPSTSTTPEKVDKVLELIMKDILGVRRLNAVLVPKDLTFEQKNARKETASLNLEATTDDPELLKRVITGDETWIYGFDSETTQQESEWRFKNEPRPKKARKAPSKVKVMLTVFFDYQGIFHHDIQQQGSTITADYYLVVLRRLREAIRQKRPELWRSKSWILHHDNAPAHTALKISKFLQDHSASVFPQTPYSPDLVISSFLESSKKLKGRKFQSIEEIKVESKKAMKAIPKTDYQRCFAEWKKVDTSNCIIPFSPWVINIAKPIINQDVNTYFSNTPNLFNRLRHPLTKANKPSNPINKSCAVTCEHFGATYVGETVIEMEDQRICINFCVKNGFKGAEIFWMLQTAYGDAVMSRRRVFEWYKRFKEGREETADNERSGRPSTSTTPEKVDKVLELVREDRRITVREVAEKAGISFVSTQSIIKDILGVRRLNAVLFPKDLTFDQKNARKETASLNLEATTDDPELLKRVITGDETWIYGFDSETTQQASEWHFKNEPRPKKARKTPSKVKVMLTVFFD
ncbi:hypothetical protein LAZ67_X000548 [Cordylochernes scorpioides]|uniref:Mos1 transposase HTH domain-containing protein n=1 Tax=Cordylochernes scorpioides TaxID=51811 RepID=A0ABY6LUA2_9ARAC|nr:hypothetical protein LAZ67_X000548 [Cordylochernes scorpioides]